MLLSFIAHVQHTNYCGSNVKNKQNKLVVDHKNIFFYSSKFQLSE